MYPVQGSPGLLTSANGQSTTPFLTGDAPLAQHRWSDLFLLTIWSFCFVAAVAFGLRTLERAVTPLAAGAASTYDAVLISVSAPQSLLPDQTSQITVTAKNIGSSTWQPSGKNFFSIYHWDPVKKIETTSLFSTPGWNSDKRPVRLSKAAVSPGQSTTFTFSIHAPAIAGSYHEDFVLTAEGAAWIKSGKFALDLTVGQQTANVKQPTVTPSVSPVPPAPSSNSTSQLPTANADWSAELVDKGGSEWQIDIEDHVTVTLAFKNTGTKTWKRDGANYVSLYATDGTKERQSAFKDYLWLSSSQAIKLKELEVKSGQIGHFLLELRAPRAPGSYKETFTLAAENASWISGSAVTFPIRVPLTSEFIATAPPGSDVITSVPDAVARPRDGSYAAALLLRSASALTLLGNGRQELTLGFKNTGTATWNSRGLLIKGVMPALAGKLSSVRDDSWVNSVQPVLINGSTKPGEIGFVNFKIKAPAKKGSYTASFALNADGQSVDGGDIDIPITVTADGYIEPEPTPSTNQPNSTPSVSPVPLNGDVSSLPAEPIIRVGLFKTTDDRMTVRAKFAPVIVSQNGTTICRVNTGETVIVTFDRTNRLYKVSGGSCSGQSSNYYRLRTEDGIAPMEISDFSRPVAWLPGANDNTFRAQLELRYTPLTDSVWVINELPFEWYLKGIAETSDSSPQEYQRALLTAARTYALYHIQRASKHANEFYHVDAKYDQVYRGYGAEARDPNVIAAVDATRGQIVTYQGKLAITPYYSRSDGRTRSWTEVWGGGPYPWLVSVPVPWDQGRTLWGHGVGLSATGSLGMARDGKRYDEILSYFYQQTELRRAYK